jgi:hypothetical protein
LQLVKSFNSKKNEISHPLPPPAYFPKGVSRGLMHKHIHHNGLPKGEPFLLKIL